MHRTSRFVRPFRPWRAAAAVALIGAALLAGAGVSAVHAKTLKLGHALPGGDHPYHLGAVKFKEVLEAKTDGRIKVEIFPSSQLGGERDMVEGLKIGTVDMVITAATIAGGIANDRKVFLLSIPYIFKDYDAVDRVLEGDVGQEMTANWPKHGFRNVGFFIAGFHQLANSKKPIRTPDDLKGMKIRAIQSKSMTLQIQSLGPNAVPMAFPEVYTGIQQGVVDGFANSLTTLYTAKYYEVAPYISVSRHGVGILSLLMSEQTYQGFSEADRKIIDQAGIEAARYQRGLYKAGDDKYLKLLREKAKVNTDVDSSAFRKHVEPYLPKFIELVNEPGAQELANRMLEQGAR